MGSINNTVWLGVSKTSIKKNRSKSKGSSFERMIAKKLSMFISEGKNDNLLWRSQNSGGRATMRSKSNLQTENQEGDITSTHPSSKYICDALYFELKNYAKIDLYTLFNDENIIKKWWSKASMESTSLNKVPVLIVKTSNKPTLWITNKKLSKKLLDNNIHYKMKIDIITEKLYIYKLEDLLLMDVSLFNSIINTILVEKEELVSNE